MGQPCAHVTSVGVGVCSCHKHPWHTSGIVINGSANVLTNHLPTARVGDMVMGHCGHMGIIIMGSATVRTNFINTARLGDSFSGCFRGVIVTGSPNVLVGA